MKRTLITVGSVTYAQKARKILLRNGIEAKLTKTDKEMVSRGCAYAVEISAADIYEAIRLLRENSIDFSAKEI